MRAFHDSRSTEYRAPYGALPLGETVELALDVWEVPDASAMLRTWIDGQGEVRIPMSIAHRSNGGAQHTRFSVELKPQAPGTIWYQFVIIAPDGRETRYGAQDGRMGGEGRLADWEPPSFKLSVYDAGQLKSGGLEAEAQRRFRDAIANFLHDEFAAPAFAESLETLREDYPAQTFARAFDIIGSSDRARLMAQLAGVADANSEEFDAFADYQLDNGRLGLAKGRLWCASLVQTLLPRELFVRSEGGNRKDGTALRAIARWSELDADCGNIARNAIDLRRTLLPCADGDMEWFAANDDVFGFWRRSANGGKACVLVNASLRNAHDVLVPLEGEAVSEVISGYAVPIVAAADAGPIPAGTPRAERYARVHLHQLGSAALYFHAEQRLEMPMEPGFGVLAHITSLPSNGTGADGAKGTLGASARSFVDWLADADVRYWQVLPVNPTDGFGSPYAGISAFAGNALLIDGDPGAIATEAPADARAYKAFCKREADWLDPYAGFMAIRQKVGARKRWQSWPAEYRAYDPAAIAADEELRAYTEGWKRVQFAFDRQWRELRAYANERDVRIIGDMPIYVSADSADVWANPGMFQLTAGGKPKAVAGCPPDSFAAEGQVWGNPLYDWDALKSGGYDWWMRRLERAFALYDIVRLDHFIGFARYYSIPAGKKAAEGSYRPGPGDDIFKTAYEKFGPLPIIAEDLGLITPAIRALGAVCGFPGMDIIQFADGNDPLAGYRPRPHKVVYTGTHDNQTLLGYAASRYPDIDAKEAAESLTAKVLACDADVCIMPLQDILGLGDEARMNVPGTAEGNWAWQAEANGIEKATDRLRSLARQRA